MDYKVVEYVIKIQNGVKSQGLSYYGVDGFFDFTSLKTDDLRIDYLLGLMKKENPNIITDRTKLVVTDEFGNVFPEDAIYSVGGHINVYEKNPTYFYMGHDFVSLKYANEKLVFLATQFDVEDDDYGGVELKSRQTQYEYVSKIWNNEVYKRQNDKNVDPLRIPDEFKDVFNTQYKRYKRGKKYDPEPDSEPETEEEGGVCSIA